MNKPRGYDRLSTGMWTASTKAYRERLVSIPFRPVLSPRKPHFAWPSSGCSFSAPHFVVQLQDVLRLNSPSTTARPMQWQPEHESYFIASRLFMWIMFIFVFVRLYGASNDTKGNLDRLDEYSVLKNCADEYT